ncbi:T6SS immunity protein Tli4 family protein [Orbus mooreae]|uniref:T6SS immunity protein Tli4 family protein n=1 Tax=Orbus mooreae TaxID=3074107 RepID=UPI00370D695E
MTKQTKFNKKSYLFIAVIAAIILVFGYHYFYKDIAMIDLPKEQQQQVTALLSNSPTRCVGTYLIDLPIGFKIKKEGRFDYKSNGDITITTKPQYLPPFKQMISLREQELKDTKTIDPIDSPYLKAVYPVHTNHPDKMQGIIFERMESPGTDDSARVLEGYRWQDEVMLKIEMKAQNGSDKKHDENRMKYPELYTNDVPQKLLELRKLFVRIQPRDDLTIPIRPGFCLLNSFMLGEDREWKDMNYGYWHESIDEFSFYFEFNDFADDYALLDKPEGYFTQGAGHTIYKGTRESQGLKLEEWVVKGKYFEDAQGFNADNMGYIFTLGIHVTDPSYKTPRLRVEMFYKIPLDKTQAYSEEQLMVIWREITNSIRIRDSSFESK